MTALHHVVFLAVVLSAYVRVCECVDALAGVCLRVLGSTDISSNVVDISRGFEDLIPSVFEELCAALLKAHRERLQQSPQRGLPSGSYSAALRAAPVSLTRSVIRRRLALYIACLFRDDWFTAWSFT